MFINYFSEKNFNTAINAGIARVILGTYLFWKIWSIDWIAISNWPNLVSHRARAPEERYWIFHIVPLSDHLEIVSYILLLFILLFIVGYRLKFASFITSILILYLSSHIYQYNVDGGTEALFIAMFFVIFFGLYSSNETYTYDHIRNVENRNLRSINNYLKNKSDKTCRLPQLKWSLLLLGLLYFISGVDKILMGPFHEWIRPDTQARFITHRYEIYNLDRFLGSWLLDYPSLLFSIGFGTILLEVGFLLVILVGGGITLFVLSLIAMHAGIAHVLGPFFLDSMIFLLLFMSWERFYSLSGTDLKVNIVYDNKTNKKSLILLKLIDVCDYVNFHPIHNSQLCINECQEYTTNGKIHLYTDGQLIEGYAALREVLRLYKIFAPFYYILGSPLVQAVGNRM